MSTYSETASKLSTQYHYILDCVQKRLLCTPSPLYILHPCIFQNVYFRLYIVSAVSGQYQSLYVVTDTGATWVAGKPPFSWLESVQSEMRLAPYYFIILIFNSRKGREGMKTFGDFQKNGNLPCPPPRSKPKIKKNPILARV